MSEVKPTYVTFEQAIWLKEKELIANCKRYWVQYSSKEYKEMSDVQLENLDEQIGIGGNLIIPKYEQWQVVEWLRVNYNIMVSCSFKETDESFMYQIHKMNSEELPRIFTNDGFNSPQEAYSAAFDYIKNNNLI